MLFQGKCEFLGRAQVKPHVKLANLVEASDSAGESINYVTPHLEWHDLFRSANESAGQLLAVFELIECNSITGKASLKVFFFTHRVRPAI